MRILLIASLALALTGTAVAVDQGAMSPTDYATGLVAARGLINTGDYLAAIETLKPVIAEDDSNADALNLMGFALRKSGDTDRALGFYLKALGIDPDHRGANEYLGELYVETGKIDLARDRLAELERICGNTTCEEYADLAKAIGD